MRQSKQIYTLGVLLLMGACATSINDLQLERVRPIAGFHPAGRPAEHDFRQSGGVVLEFSSAWDWRRQVARFGSSFLQWSNAARDAPTSWIPASCGNGSAMANSWMNWASFLAQVAAAKRTQDG